MRRVSCDCHDPGYRQFCAHGGFGRRWVVTVDGVEIPRVVTADQWVGYVIANKLDSGGNAYVAGDEVARRVIYGAVRIFVDGAELFA